jgi:hypothetical protein
MREIKVIYAVLYADRDHGNKLLGLPRYLISMFGKSDPMAIPLLVWATSASGARYPQGRNPAG